MQKLSSTDFRYFPVSQRDRRWGLTVSTIGTSHIAPNTPYPPAQHPRNYALDWEHGRILHEFQVVYITQGAGLLETRKAQWRIEAGDAFMLHPEVWHRYRPDMESGWQEDWVGFNGPVVQQLAKQRFITPVSPRFRLRDERPLANAFLELQQLRASNLFALQQVLAGHTMTILGLLVSSTRPEMKRDDKDAQVIQASITALSDPNADDIDLEELARSLSVSYSWFRRAFRERIGLSPHQFRLHLKLTAARELLRSTFLSVKEVCDQSGFHSEPYFCRLFKEQVGCTPSEFRSSGLRSSKTVELNGVQSELSPIDRIADRS
jgi:AraC-like DNA-binding protein